MTTVTIQESGGRYRLTAVGHAEGSTAACAAVSGIVYALGGYLKNLEQDGEVKLEVLLLESGAAELEAQAVGPLPRDAARHPFGMAAVGLLQIAAKYPELVAVDTRNFFKIPGGIFAPP